MKIVVAEHHDPVKVFLLPQLIQLIQKDVIKGKQTASDAVY